MGEEPGHQVPGTRRFGSLSSLVTDQPSLISRKVALGRNNAIESVVRADLFPKVFLPGMDSHENRALLRRRIALEGTPAV